MYTLYHKATDYSNKIGLLVNEEADFVDRAPEDICLSGVLPFEINMNYDIMPEKSAPKYVHRKKA